MEVFWCWRSGMHPGLQPQGSGCGSGHSDGGVRHFVGFVPWSASALWIREKGMLNRRSVPMGEDQHECSKDERFTICTRRPWWLGPGQRKVAHSVYHLIFFFLNVGGSVILEMSILF